MEWHILLLVTSLNPFQTKYVYQFWPSQIANWEENTRTKQWTNNYCNQSDDVQYCSIINFYPVFCQFWGFEEISIWQLASSRLCSSARSSLSHAKKMLCSFQSDPRNGWLEANTWPTLRLPWFHFWFEYAGIICSEHQHQRNKSISALWTTCDGSLDLEVMFLSSNLHWLFNPYMFRHGFIRMGFDWGTKRQEPCIYS